ncbi:MAG: hypothetical protein AABY52_03880 [Deltaproteobacteria bacterium]
MKKILVLLVALTVAVAFSAVTFADEAKKMEPAKAAAPAETVKAGSGTVTAVDAKAMTITVKTKKGEKVIAITDESKITVGKEAKSIADVKVGDKVKVKVAKAAKNPCAKNPCAKK